MKAALLISLALLVPALAPNQGPLAAPASGPRAGVAENLLEALRGAPPGRDLDLIVQFRDWPSEATLDRLRGAGMGFHEHLRTIPAWHATGDRAAVQAAVRDPAVRFLELNEPLRYLLDAATHQVRARDVWDAPAASGREGIVLGGQVVDGTGVGIAIVDSGIDARHPDLPWHSKVVKNYFRTVPGLNGSFAGVGYTAKFVDVPNSDTTSGHGTHVAGIAAGLGAASGGKFQGVAPGAALYGFGVGQGLSVLSANDAFDFILYNQGNFSPPIRVVSNSWGGCGGTHNPESVESRLVARLVNAGISVLFAQGNIDLTCPAPGITTQALNPTPGVISVGNFNGGDHPARSGTIDASSAEGRANDPETWPDVAAPGTDITSTATQGAAIFGAPNGYSSATGTSMATPAVAGVLALLYQTRPSLTPAEAQQVVRRTAFVYDPAIDAQLGHPKLGFGLVDAFKALHALTGLGASDGVQALEAVQGSTLALDRTGAPPLAGGALTLRGDVRVLAEARGYLGEPHIYQGQAVDPYALTDIFVPLPKVASAGEPVRLSARNVEAWGGSPNPANLSSRITVRNAQTGGLAFDQASTVVCSTSALGTECRTDRPWTIPATIQGGLHRLTITVQQGGVDHLVATMPFHIVGANPDVVEDWSADAAVVVGPPVRATSNASVQLAPLHDEEPGATPLPPPPGTPAVQARVAGGAWVDALLDPDGVHWEAALTIPGVVADGGVLEVRATLAGRTVTDRLTFQASPQVRVTGPADGVLGQPLTFLATAAPPGAYTFEWDADYDGTTLDVDGTTASFTHTYGTSGAKTLAVRVLDAFGNGAIRTHHVDIVRAVTLVDVAVYQAAPAGGQAVATSLVGLRSNDAVGFPVFVPSNVTALRVDLNWTVYDDVDAILTVTNDFDLWLEDPEEGYDTHGGATANWGEHVEIADPAPGAWRIDVTPYLITAEDTYRVTITALQP